MALAKVFLPELLLTTGGGEDLSVSFPRAPPPSPEMQSQGHNELFEIPTSKFEGIRLDLKRTSFPLADEEDDYPVQLLEKLGFDSVPLDDFPEMFPGGDIHEDDILACSPRKRVCCASNTTITTHRTVTTFPSSSSDTRSLVSNGFGSYKDNHHRKEKRTTNISMGFADTSGDNLMMSTAPTFLSSSAQILTSPHITPPKIEGVMPILKDSVKPAIPFPIHTSSSGTTGDCHHQLLSHSSDLHTTHPHLPHSFEATQLVEACSTLSHTLNSTSLHEALLPNQQALESNQDAGQRKRKISIKRKNPEEDDNDSALQFSFDHSHSSTGSESDWVLVEKQTDSNRSSEKKACSAIHPVVLAHSLREQHYSFDGSTTPSAINAEIVKPVEEPCDLRIMTPFLDTGIRHEVDVSRVEENVAVRNQVMESAMMMDLGRQWEDMEKMETEVHHTSMECCSNMPTLSSIAHDTNAATVYPCMLRPHPPCPLEFEGYLHDLLSVPTRHSYVDGFLHQPSKSEELWWLNGNGEQVLLDSNMDTRLALSKSL